MKTCGRLFYCGFNLLQSLGVSNVSRLTTVAHLQGQYLVAHALEFPTRIFVAPA